MEVTHRHYNIIEPVSYLHLPHPQQGQIRYTSEDWVTMTMILSHLIQENEDGKRKDTKSNCISPIGNLEESGLLVTNRTLEIELLGHYTMNAVHFVSNIFLHIIAALPSPHIY